MRWNDPLHSAIEELYTVFERYRPQGKIEHSPYKPHSAVEPLETKPLRGLTARDFAAYSGSAVWTMGSLDDFKYFFPRIAELALEEPVGGSDWQSWAYRLAPGLTTPSEQAAVRNFFWTVWHTVVTSDNDSLHVDVVDVLFAMHFIFDDLEPLLAVFHPCRSPAALRSLHELCSRGAEWDEFGSEEFGSEPAPQLSKWLAERAPSALADATKAFASGGTVR